MSTADSISIVSLVVAILALCVAWASLIQTRKWNKVQTIWDFIDEPRLESLTDCASAALKDLLIDINRGAPVTATEASRIYEDTAAENEVGRLLTYFERFSAGVNVGAIDRELAYQFTVGKVVNT